MKLPLAPYITRYTPLLKGIEGVGEGGIVCCEGV